MANLDTVLSSPTLDGNNAIQWFEVKWDAGQPWKFSVCAVSPCYFEWTMHSLHWEMILLYFQNPVTIARQLNFLARISRYIDVSSRKMIYNSLILSNCTYRVLVWHFCGKVNNGKIEKINERALWILYNDYASTYDEQLDLSNSNTILLTRKKTWP